MRIAMFALVGGAASAQDWPPSAERARREWLTQNCGQVGTSQRRVNVLWKTRSRVGPLQPVVWGTGLPDTAVSTSRPLKPGL